MQGSLSEAKKTESFLQNLWDTSIFKQVYLSYYTGLIILMLSLVQTSCLIFDNSLLIFPQQTGSLYTFLENLNKLVIGRGHIDMITLSMIDSILMISLALYILLIILALIILGVSLKKRFPLPLFLRKLWIPWSYIHFFVLVSPIHQSCLSQLLAIVDSAITKSWKNILVVVFTIIVMSFNAAFALFHLTLNVVHKTKDPLSRSNDYSMGLWIIHKLVVGTLTQLAWMHSSPNEFTWIITFFNLFFAVISLGVIFRTVPFYKRALLKLSIAFHSLFLPFTGVNFIFLVIPSLRQGIRIYFILIILMTLFPLAIKIGLIHLSQIQESWYVILRKSEANKNNYMLAQAIRSMKKATSTLTRLDLKTGVYLKNQLLDLTYQKHVTEDPIIESSRSILSSSSSTHDQFRELIDSIYMIHKNNNLVLLILADYYFRKCNKFCIAYDILHRVLANGHVKSAEKLSALLLISDIQKSILIQQQAQRNQKVDLIHFMNAMENYNKLGRLISEQLDSREKLYLLLEQETPCLLSIAKISHTIQRIQKKTNKLWEQLSEKSLEEYPPLIKIYALFVIFVELQHDK